MDRAYTIALGLSRLFTILVGITGFILLICEGETFFPQFIGMGALLVSIGFSHVINKFDDEDEEN